MPFCTKCGHEIPVGTGFCPSCGMPVTPVATRGRLPVELGKEEKELRRAEEVKLRGPLSQLVGSLILTNRRLIFDGELLKERGERGRQIVFEWSLGDILDVSQPLFGGKELRIKFQRVISSLVTPELKLERPAVYRFTNVDQPQKWKTDIIELKK